jgi:competence protein ComEC
VRDDVPAALPLIGLLAGLATGPVLVNPRAALLGLIAVTALCLAIRAAARLPLFFALGILLALRAGARDTAERNVFADLDPERFVTIEAPLERDWAPRDASYVLRASQFRIGSVTCHTPLSIYARFEPPEIAMEATVRAEGFLRLNEQGRYALTLKSAALLSYEGRLPWWHPAAWNRALANRLERSAARYPDEVALAQAILLGRGERLSDELRDGFRRGGTYHLLVFSGLQIAFAAALLAALLRWLHAPRAADWLLLSFAGLAPLFIGPTASVARAAIAIGLYAVSRILHRPTSLENLWCVAALLRLIAEPHDLTDPAFHLTYAGAGALLFVGKHLLGRRWLSHAVAAEVTLTPLTLFHFHQFALGGSILTLLMSPLIFVMLIAAMLACLVPRFLAAIGLLHRLCTVMNAGGLSGYFAAPPLPALIAGAALALVALAVSRGRTRAVAIAVALTIPTAAAIVRSVSHRSVAEPRVTFFDVGQGDAVALRSGARTMLVDTGRDDEQLLPLLADRGIRRIEAIVLTHAHPDHCGSLPALVERFDVGRVWINPRRFRGDCAVKVLEACSVSKTPVFLVRDGSILHLGSFTIEVHLTGSTFRRAPENNASVVLRAEAGGRRFLLTGDIEKEAELWLGDRDLRADVLKVAHHGSRTSSSPAFLDAVAPRLAVISCGRHNLFGHPHQAVLDDLAGRRVRTWRTDRDGSIDVEVHRESGRPTLYARAGSD